MFGACRLLYLCLSALSCWAYLMEPRDSNSYTDSDDSDSDHGGFIGPLIITRFLEVQEEIETLVDEVGVTNYLTSFDVSVRVIQRCKIVESALNSMLLMLNPFMDPEATKDVFEFPSLFSEHFDSDTDDDDGDGDGDGDGEEAGSNLMLVKERFFRRLEKRRLSFLIAKDNYKNVVSLYFSMPFETISAFISASYLIYFESVKLLMLKVRKGDLVNELEDTLKNKLAMPNSIRKGFIANFTAKWLDELSPIVGITTQLFGESRGMYRAASYVAEMSQDLQSNIIMQGKKMGKKLNENHVFENVVSSFYREALSVAEDVFWNKTNHVDYVARISDQIGKFYKFLNFPKYVAVNASSYELGQVKLHNELVEYVRNAALGFVEPCLEAFTQLFELYSKEGQKKPNFKIISLKITSVMRKYMSVAIGNIDAISKEYPINAEDISCMCPIYFREWSGFILETRLYQILKKIVKITSNLYDEEILVDDSSKKFRKSLVVTATDLKELITFVLDFDDKPGSRYIDDDYTDLGTFDSLSLKWSSVLLRKLSNIRNVQVNREIDKNIVVLRNRIAIEDLDFWDYSKDVCFSCLYRTIYGSKMTKVPRPKKNRRSKPGPAAVLPPLIGA